MRTTTLAVNVQQSSTRLHDKNRISEVPGTVFSGGRGLIAAGKGQQAWQNVYDNQGTSN